jgi:uncharacterized protein
VRVINKTQNKTLAEKIIIPKTFLDQSLGLIKYKTPVAMLLKTRYGIHTIGMKYTIDVLILDKQNRVVVTKVNLKPNRIFVWNLKYETVLELPHGTINKTKTLINDHIDLS